MKKYKYLEDESLNIKLIIRPSTFFQNDNFNYFIELIYVKRVKSF